MRFARVCPVVLSLVACGPSTSTSVVETNASTSPSSGRSIERYFPLVHDHVWNYELTTDEGRTDTMIVRARRTSGTKGELVTPRKSRMVSFSHEGVMLVETGVFVLKAPLALGTRWRGEHGGITTIDATAASVTVAAGSFTNCVVTTEERGGDVRATYTTTFCPDVGIVLLEVEAGEQHERAELRNYGPPVFIGPAGTTLIGPGSNQ